MAKITGKGYRRGRFRARSQTYSRRRHTYTKRDTPREDDGSRPRLGSPQFETPWADVHLQL
jgi:hypothetical protein